MAINSSGSASLIWRVRKSGNNLNGGGYDPAVSGVLATTLSSTLATGATSMSVASASGWPSSGNYYARIGQNTADVGASRGDALIGSEVVLVTGGQGTTTWTVTRGQLGTSDPGVSWASGTPVDNELTRCNTAPASGTHGTSTASTTFVDAVFNAFNLTHVGLAIYLSSGTGATAGFYTVQSITSSSTVVLDRASGTYTVGVWSLGGGWADPRTNTNSGQAAINAGNTLYIQGPGTDPVGPRTADYTPGASFTFVLGVLNTGTVKMIGEFGRPALQGSVNQCVGFSLLTVVSDLYFMGKATSTTPIVGLSATGEVQFINCVWDQNGFDQICINNVAATIFTGCEFFNSGSAPAANNNVISVKAASNLAVTVQNCNFHDLTSGVLDATDASQILTLIGNIFAKCGADCITLGSATPGSDPILIQNNTFDANVANCITISVQDYLGVSSIFNNIFTNNTGVGANAINVTAGTTAANNLIKRFIDYNTFYNNTANVAGISQGAHDTLAASSPYVAQSTENYNLA
jgi:hypothetical protein